MTASTTILAMIPLAMGLGEGGDAQAPMARAIIGGLISSNLITLIILPAIYTLVEGKKLTSAPVSVSERTGDLSKIETLEDPT